MARRDALLRLNKTLIARRNELRKRLGTEYRTLRVASDEAGDVADIAFGSTGVEIDSTLAGFEAKELAQVERAILRLKQGRYGVCEGCACKIPVARLDAQPTASLCISCQRDVERDARSGDDRMSHGWDAVRDSDEVQEMRMKDFVFN
ncbi:MAG: TraR/DksA family transcriptional regulator [Gemmataceae bacterium]